MSPSAEERVGQLFPTEWRRISVNPERFHYQMICSVAVASVTPFFEPKARRKEYGGLEATATPAEVSFRCDPAVRSRWRR